VLFPRDPLPALDLGALRTVKNEEGKKGCAHEPCTTKEECSQFRILSLSSVRCMEEPDGCIDAHAKTSEIGMIALESVHDCYVGERSQFPRGSKNLINVKDGSHPKVQKVTYIPEPGYTHPSPTLNNGDAISTSPLRVRVTCSGHVMFMLCVQDVELHKVGMSQFYKPTSVSVTNVVDLPGTRTSQPRWQSARLVGA